MISYEDEFIENRKLYLDKETRALKNIPEKTDKVEENYGIETFVGNSNNNTNNNNTNTNTNENNLNDMLNVYINETNNNTNSKKCNVVNLTYIIIGIIILVVVFILLKNKK